MTKEPVKVLSRDSGVVGLSSGHTYRCQMEGCTGVRLTVKWPDGKVTRPCTKGMDRIDERVWRIE